jgi:ATP-dependent Clp protease ATP-binding subunit ClpA
MVTQDPQEPPAVERLTRDEPTATLRALARMRADLNTAEERLVAEALRAGASWSQIGAALGVTRQAAHARYRNVASAEPASDITVTIHARRAVRLAREQAAKLGVAVVGTEHLLLGLLAADDLPAATALTRLGVSLHAARRALEAVQPVAPAVGRDRKAKPRLSAEARTVLERSLHEARQRGHSRLGAEHLLLALLHDARCEAVNILGRLGVTPSNVHAQLGFTPS